MALPSPGAFGPGAAGGVLVDPLASTLGEGLVLQAQVLIGRGHPGVPDEHLTPFLLPRLQGQQPHSGASGVDGQQGHPRTSPGRTGAAP